MALPQRGTGLLRGTARARRYPPLTEAERMARHTRIYGAGNSLDIALIFSLGGILFAGLMIGVCMLK